MTLIYSITYCVLLSVFLGSFLFEVYIQENGWINVTLFDYNQFKLPDDNIKHQTCHYHLLLDA